MTTSLPQRPRNRCSVCGTPFEDTGKKQQCRRCGMFAHLCCDPQIPVEECAEAGVDRGGESDAGRTTSAGIMTP